MTISQQLIMDCVTVPDNTQAYELSKLLTDARIESSFLYLSLSTNIMLDAGSGSSKLWIGTSPSTGAAHYGTQLYADQITIPIVTVGCKPGTGIYLATDAVAGVTVAVSIGIYLAPNSLSGVTVGVNIGTS
jgi:hypothetical protein